MSHIHNAQRPGIGAASTPLDAEIQRTSAASPSRVRWTTVHAVACDCTDCGSLTHRSTRPDGTVARHACVHETHNHPTPEHEWYVPSGWAIYPDGTHRCPDCRTKAAVEADLKEQAQMVRDFEKQYGDGCVNCGKNWDEHHHPELRHAAACELHVHGRQLARPLYKVRQHGYGLKNWDEHPDSSHHVGHLVGFGEYLSAR